MIALLHAARAQGAVERYVEQVSAALGGEGVLVEADGEASLRELVGILRRLRPQVAHVMDVWPQAVVAARLARVPRVLVTHHTPELPRRDNLAGRVWQRLGWLARPEVIYTSEVDRRRDGRSPSHVVALGIDLDRFAGARPALHSDRPLVGTSWRVESLVSGEAVMTSVALEQSRPGLTVRADFTAAFTSANSSAKVCVPGGLGVTSQIVVVKVELLLRHEEESRPQGLIYPLLRAANPLEMVSRELRDLEAAKRCSHRNAPALRGRLPGETARRHEVRR